MECRVRNIPAHTSTRIAKVAKSTIATLLIDNSYALVAAPMNIKLLAMTTPEGGSQGLARRLPIDLDQGDSE